MVQREQQIRDWLNKILPTEQFSCEPASADASFRRYFRIQYHHNGANISQILMDAPPDKEDSEPFVRVAELMRGLGVNVPAIIDKDLQQGLLLLSDLGKEQYLEQLNASNVDTRYKDALDALFILQQADVPASAKIPAYDHALLMREMNLFPEWYVQAHLQQTLGAEQALQLQQVFELLAESALQQPQVLVHRDYHSRNLMFTESQNPGVIDFQDAVMGAVSYDLVSLLRDCYVSWPRSQVERWALAYLHRCQVAGFVPQTDDSELLRWFDWMGVQRHLKATGIFARLNHRDGKPGYLNDIPRTLGYVKEVAGRYDELQALHSLLNNLPNQDKEKSA